MLNNYLKSAFKNLLRNKLNTAINLIGLSIGMACTILILLYVQYELSYDSFHKNRNNLYRINKISYENGEMNYKSAFTFSGQGPVIKSEIPEVEDYVRLLHTTGPIQYNNQKDELISFRENDIYYADSSFFSLFSYNLLKGDSHSVLQKPNSIVLSESSVKKYFGDDDPLGKIVKYGKEDFTVTGIFEDIPHNSHLTFGALISFNSLKISNSGDWTNHSYYTYLLLKEKTDPSYIESKISKVQERFINEYHGKKVSNFWNLQRVDKIFLFSTDFTSISMEYGNYKMVLYLFIIALLILIIALVNYINYTTAQLPYRTKEIGIKKAVGAEKTHLILQFVTESFLINFIAFLVCIMVIEGTIGVFQRFLEINISLFKTTLNWFYPGLIFLLLMGISLTCLYPALWLSAVPAVTAIRRNSVHSKTGGLLRKVLITFQFSISVVLIIITFIMYKQISYTQNKDLGLNMDNILIVRAPNLSEKETDNNILWRFKQIISANSMIRNVSLSLSIPGERFGFGNRGSINRIESNTNENNYFRLGRVDNNFIDIYKINLLAGKNFSYESNDQDAMMINKEAMLTLGYSNPEEAINKYLKWNNRLFRITGVVDNFHQQSLHRNIEPIILYNSGFEQHFNYISLKLSDENIDGSLSYIEKTYKSVFPGQPFDYFFLDDFFNKQYRSDFKTGEIITAFALIALIIAALGLFSLSSYTALKRTKEIGIRKVMGASTLNILIMLINDYVKWIFIANLVAFPIAWYFMNNWLQGFVYRIEMNLWIFFLSGFIVFSISLLIISWHTWITAAANPIKSLKYE
jgi:putative ABC transport system permease protein